MRIKLGKRKSFQGIYEIESRGINPFSGSMIIDTGCAFTAIALRGRLEDNVIEKMLLSDFHAYQDEVVHSKPITFKPIYGLGVNDDRNDKSRLPLSDVWQYSDQEIKSRKDLGFIKRVDILKINGVSNMLSQATVKEAVYKDWVLRNRKVQKYCADNKIDIQKLRDLKVDYMPDRIVFFVPPEDKESGSGYLCNDRATQPKAVLGVIVKVVNNSIKVVNCEKTEYTDVIVGI